jgi:hypothetical protein
MAGALTISTLNNDTGVLATQNGMTGIAKAWVNFDGTGTPAIRGSFNVSSITDNGTGDYTINFTTVMPNSNYAGVVTSGQASDGTNLWVCTKNANAVPTTSAWRIVIFTRSGGTNTDSPYITASVFSS